MFKESSHLENVMEISNMDIIHSWCMDYFRFIFMQINKLLTFIN